MSNFWGAVHFDTTSLLYMINIITYIIHTEVARRIYPG